MGRVKEKSAEDWHIDAVGQNGQVCLGKLEGCAVLLDQLPHTLQEEQEDWGLTLWGKKIKCARNLKYYTFNKDGGNL